MRLPFSRRGFLTTCAAGAISASTTRAAQEQTADLTAAQANRVRGLLIGGLLGDALGGPVEFKSGPDVDAALPNTRSWPDDRRVSQTELEALAESIKLHGYEALRPDTAPYGPWIASAPAGTVTDDSRHKMVLMRALSHAAKTRNWPLNQRDLAKQYSDFRPNPKKKHDQQTDALNEEGMREYVYAARWVLGERDLDRAKPIERIWSGISTCSGQMLLPPLSAVFPGRPNAAYRAAFDINFVDAPEARDFAAALVAGLAAVLDRQVDDWPARKRWDLLLRTMRTTDPFEFAAVPFAGRPLHRWLDLAKKIATEAKGQPAELFRRLETDGKPVYWWDAHFTLVVPLAILHFCDFNPLASLQLCLDFRHDTDSYAQVAGCLVGAVEGADVFPNRLTKPLLVAVEDQYSVRIEEWMSALDQCRILQQQS